MHTLKRRHIRKLKIMNLLTLVAILIGFIPVIPTTYAAESINVHVRVEGIDSTLLDTNVEVPAGSYPADALVTAAEGNVDVVADGGFVTSIGGEETGLYEGDWNGWLSYTVNNGIVEEYGPLSDNDEVVYYYGTWDPPTPLTKLEAPEEVVAGEEFAVKLVDIAGDNAAVVGATVYCGEDYDVTDASGEARFTAPSEAGPVQLTAEKRDETSVPTGKPLIVRPLPASMNVINPTVHVRVEGIDSTLLDTNVEVPAGSYPADALVTAAEGNVDVVADGGFVTSIGGEETGLYEGDWNGWLSYTVNNGIVEEYGPLSDNDEVVYYYGTWDPPTPLTKLEAPEEVVAGEEFAVKLVDIAGDNAAVVGATVYCGEDYDVTDASGEARFTASSEAGPVQLTAEKRDETSVPTGKPLMVRPMPITVDIVNELSNPGEPSIDLPTAPSFSLEDYDKDLKLLTVTGSVSNAATINGILETTDSIEICNVTDDVINNKFTLIFENVNEQNYILTLTGISDSGLEGLTTTSEVSLFPEERVTDEIINQAKEEAITYIRNQQEDNGDLSLWGAMALVEAGEDLLSEEYTKNGLTYFDYLAGYEPSSTSDLVKMILTLAVCGQDPTDFEGRNLIDELNNDGNGLFDIFSTHLWTIRALNEAGEPITQAEQAKQWILDQQKEDGSWGYQEGADSSSDITAEAVIALHDLGEPKDSQYIQKALDWLKTMQRIDGGFKYLPNSKESNPYSTIEVARALLELEINPLQDDWLKPSGEMLSYLVNQQGEDGKISELTATANALTVFSMFSKQFNAEGTGELGGSQDSGGQVDYDSVSVYITVTGKNGVTVLSKRRITVNDDDEFGMTPLGALAKTGLSFTTKFDEAYVSSIDGVAEDLRGTAGWVWEVNGDRPGLACNDFTLEDGDEVVWLWVNDANEGGFNAEKLVDMDTPPEISREEAEIREKISEEAQKYLQDNKFSGLSTNDIPVFGVGRTLTNEEVAYWLTVIKENELDEEFPVNPGDKVTLQDKRKEIRLEIPETAMKKSVRINLKKLSATDTATDNGSDSADRDKLLTPVYEFGPSGLVFDDNVFVTLKAIVPPGQSPFDVYMAWYDEDNQEWVKVPAVMDLANGEITGALQHFSKYAVFCRETKFSDMESHKWAEEAMKSLVQRGIVVGVGQERFDPERNVTRAEFVKMLVNALEITNSAGEKQTLTDLPDDEWYTPYVKQAIDRGLVSGYPDGTFRPMQKISRQEMVTILMNARNYLDALKVKHAESAETGFKDNKEIASWSKTAVDWAVANKIVNGMGDNRFYPAQPTTRAQAAVVINNVLRLR